MMVRYGAKISNLSHKSNSPARNFPANGNAPLFVPTNDEGYPARRYGWKGEDAREKWANRQSGNIP